MLTIKTEVIINKSPEAVYNWVLELNDEKYRKWRPAHRAFHRKGLKVFLKEEVEGQKLTVKGKIAAQVPNKELRFKGRVSIMPGYLWMRL